MIPNDLNRLLSENDEDDIRISIDRIDFSTEQIKMDLTFLNEIWGWDDQVELESQRWTLTIPHPVKYNIATYVCYQFEIVNNHPLLLLYTDRWQSLYFKGPATDVKALMADIFTAQLEVFDSLYNLTNFLNSERNVEALLRAPSALLAKGPRTIIDKYASCLQAHNLPYSIVDGWQPTYWNGGQNVDTVEKLKLLLMGDTYVVAEEFLFEKRN